MKARHTELTLLIRRHLHGLDTQCWQRIPLFNCVVVTMDTTSTPISITLHMALCEGHTGSEIQLKASEMKALHGWWTVSGWRSWLNWMFLTSSCHGRAAGVTLIMVKNEGITGLWGDLNLTWLDTFAIRIHVLLQCCMYIFIHELNHTKPNSVHTLPQNVSIIQTQSYSACFSCFLSDIPFTWLLFGEQLCKAGEFQSGLFIPHPLPSPCQSGSSIL